MTATLATTVDTGVTGSGSRRGFILGVLSDDDFSDGLAVRVDADRGVGERERAQLILGRVCRRGDPAAQLAVDLHRHDDLGGLRDRGVE